ncbi:hypothetical protein K4F52_003309 [Lecanicillium sp. MT-2017a]|nr:hypothetical protein K4F52_003309 [Lecanicillium sp. MT-2017a]
MKLDPSMSIHGLLAAEFALEPPRDTYWGTLIQRMRDFEASTPFFWCENLQRCLPEEAAQVLRRQQERREYVYAWFLVNTRGFYYETPEMLRYPWVDRLALLPVADLFNHAATGCLVTFTAKGYIVKTDCEFAEGDEVCFSYGEHSNDVLLAEYGFLLEGNNYDKVCIDGFVLSGATEEQKVLLGESDILGGYYIDAEGHLNDTARQALQLIDGSRDGAPEESRTTVNAILKKFHNEVKMKQRAINADTDGELAQRETLAARWSQIEAVVERALAAHDES